MGEITSKDRLPAMEHGLAAKEKRAAARLPTTGHVAIRALVELLFPGWPWRSSLIDMEMGWRVEYQYRREDDPPQCDYWMTLEEIERTLGSLETDLQMPRAMLGLSPVSRQAAMEVRRPSGDASCAVGGFVLDVPFAALFEETGPLAALRVRSGGSAEDPRRLAPEEWKEALRFTKEHLARSRFPPTAAVAYTRGVHAYYGLTRALILSPQVREELGQAARQVSQLLHGARPMAMDEVLPLPLTITRNGKRIVLATLLEAHPQRRYDLDALLQDSQDPARHLVVPSRTGQRQEQPPIMEARTLPEGWGIQDVDLPPEMIQVLTTGRVGVEVVDTRWVAEVVRTMAVRRYGWFDAELLLKDPRFELARLANFVGYAARGLRRVFRGALDHVAAALPPRLPYGIEKIVRLVDEDAVDGSVKRYQVKGGGPGRPFALEVTFRTLMSPGLFRTALGQRLELVPYRVSRRVWDALMGAALADPRISTEGSREAPDAPRSLEDWILEYASGASPSESFIARSGSEASNPWPLLKDGLAVFPLRDLTAWLARRVAGEPRALREVTTAIRALGGDDFGSVRLGRGVRRRCWFVPYPGREPGRPCSQVPAPGGAQV